MIETWFVSKLGTDALAGMALVFPGVMLMQMISAGAMGGGISSAIARALGAGRRDEADALVLHALVINVALGASFSRHHAGLRPADLPRARRRRAASSRRRSPIRTSCSPATCCSGLLNGLASVIRGTGNMLVPASVICVGVVVLVPLSPLLIFGIGPFPALGIAGGGVALVAFYAAGTAVLAWYVLSGRNLARLRPARLRWPLFRDILRRRRRRRPSPRVQTNVIIALATALVATAAGPAAAAGYGTGARLEYLLVPLVFGLGAPLVAMVGTNIGAGQRERALRIAFVGGAIAFAITEAIGIAAALWPNAWISLFSADPRVIEAGNRLSARRRTVLRILRARARALFRLAGRGPVVLAAHRRLPAHAGRDRRRLAGAAPDRLAELAVRRARARPRCCTGSRWSRPSAPAHGFAGRCAEDSCPAARAWGDPANRRRR